MDEKEDRRKVDDMENVEKEEMAKVVSIASSSKKK